MFRKKTTPKTEPITPPMPEHIYIKRYSDGTFLASSGFPAFGTLFSRDLVSTYKLIKTQEVVVSLKSVVDVAETIKNILAT